MDKFENRISRILSGQKFVYSVLFFYFVLPGFQFLGFGFLNLKILVSSGLLFVGVMHYNLTFTRISVLSFALTFLYLIFRFLLVGYNVNHLYELNFITGLLLILYFRHGIMTKTDNWKYLLIISAIIALFQLSPLRKYFFLFYGSVQGLLSTSIYSRASGLTSSFYVYSWVTFIFIYLAQERGKYYFLAVLSNSRLGLLPAMYGVVSSLKKRTLLFAGLFVIIVLGPLLLNFRPVGVFIDLLLEIINTRNFDVLLLSKNPSIAQRVADFNEFGNVFSSGGITNKMFGYGSHLSKDMELGIYYTLLNMGVIGAIAYYGLPFVLALGTSRTIRIFLLLLFVGEFVSRLLIKWELYIMVILVLLLDKKQKIDSNSFAWFT